MSTRECTNKCQPLKRRDNENAPRATGEYVEALLRRKFVFSLPQIDFVQSVRNLNTKKSFVLSHVEFMRGARGFSPLNYIGVLDI